MPYLGQRPSKGDENNFKILDDISSYTLTFDGSDASVVSAANDTITSLNHRFVQGQRVTYNKWWWKCNCWSFRWCILYYQTRSPYNKISNKCK
ncbi:MAG: hypothetical protein CM15mV142_520 [Caudoviricetes sp.]|nr:MAG: hypothetical protein CM15mV142_520 [Caudoviricetes sp.]